MRKENTVEDQDRKTPEEEVEVEGHGHDIQDAQDLLAARNDDDDFEGHALRDVQDVQDVQRSDDKDVQDVL
jgi:hypothetical protein